jgi:hypothetical protein
MSAFDAPHSLEDVILVPAQQNIALRYTVISFKGGKIKTLGK